MKMLKNALVMGSLGSFVYFAGLYLLYSSNLALSATPDWLFRALLFLVILFCIFRQRILFGRNLNFKQGFITGLLCSLVMALGMSLATYVFRSQIAQDYENQAKAIYAQNRRQQMLASRLSKLQQEDADRNSLTAEDSSIVEKGLSKHMELTSYYFTPSGGSYATGIYALIWGLAFSLVGAYLFRNFQAEPNQS
jgi:hypothetical protein